MSAKSAKKRPTMAEQADKHELYELSLIHISEPTRPFTLSRMPSSA